MSAKKKRLGSRRRVANQNETSQADDVTESTFVAQRHIPEEDIDSLNAFANLDNSQSETQHPPSPELSGNRRKLGSSRRNKGQHVKDTVTESYHEPREEVEQKTKAKETITKQMSLAIQPDGQEVISQGNEHIMIATHGGILDLAATPDYSSEVQNSTTNCAEADLESLIPKSENLQADSDENGVDSKVVSDSYKLLETMQEGIDKSDIFHKEEVEESAHVVGISEMTSLSVLSFPTVDQQLTHRSNFGETSVEKLSNVSSVTETEGKESNDNTELFRQDGNLKGNSLVSESHVEAVVMQYSTTPEITTETISPNTEIECSVRQAALSSPKEELPTDEEQNEHVTLSEVVGAHHSDDAVNNVHVQEIKLTEMHEIDYTSEIVILDATEYSEIISVKSADDSPTNQEISSSDDKQDEHPTKENNVEKLEQEVEDYHVYDTKEPQISDIDRVDTALHQVYDIESQVEGDTEPSAEETGHQEKEGLFSEMEESEFFLQPLQSEIDAAFDSVRDSAAESSHKPTEEVTRKNMIICDNEDHETTEMSLTTETAVQEKTMDTVLEGMDKFGTAQTEDVSDQVKENVLVGISNLTSSSSHSSSTVDQQTIDHSNVMEMPDEEPPNVSSVIDKENKEGDDDNELFRQDGNKDAQYSEDSVNKVHEQEVKPTENQEMPQIDYSPESVIHDATEYSGIISGNLMEQTEISGTYQSELTVKTDDSPHNQEISNPDDKQDEHPIKQHNYEALEQRNEDHVYEIGGREENDITPSAEQTGHQEKEELYSEMESLQSKIDVHYDSQPEQDDTGFNPIGKRRKLASSRRNKGRRHVKGSAESNHEHKDEDVESTRGNEASETADDYSPESVIDDVTEHSGIISGNLMEQTEISETCHSDLTVKSADDSPANQEISNPDDKEDEHPTKENNVEKLEHKVEDYYVYDTKDPQVSEIERVDTAPGQIYEIEGRVEGDTELSAEETGHQEKEGLFSEMEESELFLQTLQSEIDAAFDSDLETTEMSLTTETAVQGKSMDTVLEEFDNFGTAQTEDVSDQVKENVLVGISNLTSSSSHSSSTVDQQTIDHSNVTEMPDEEPPNVSSVIDKENKEGDDDNELFRQDGNKDAQYSEDSVNKVHEQEVKPTENQEMSQIDYSPESVIHDATEYSGIISGNLMEQTEISDTYQSELTVKTDDSPHNQEISNPDDKQDEHSIKQHNYEALEPRNEDHVYDTKEPQISNIQRVDSELGQVYEIGGREESDIPPSAEQTGHQEKEGLYSEMESLQSKIDVHYDSQPEQDDTGFNPIGKRRKLASSRRNKGRRHVKGSAESNHEHKEEDVESTRGNEASETAEMLLPKERASQEGLSQGSEHDIMPATHDSSLYSAIMSGYSSEVQNAATTNYSEADWETLIPKRENIQDDHDERETNFKVEMSDKSVGATLEGTDKYAAFQSQEVRGDHHSEDALNELHGQEVKPAENQEMPENDHSPESVIDDVTEHSGIISGNLMEQTEISETCHSDLTVKNSPANQEISNPDDKEDEHPTKENNVEKLEHKVEDYHVYDTKDPWVSEIERVDTAPGQLYEIEGRVEGDTELSAEETGHQEKEGLFSEMEESEFFLQTLQSEIDAAFDSDLETTEMSLTTETAVQGKSMDTVLEEFDNFGAAQTEDVSDQVKENVLVGISNLTSSSSHSSSTVDQQTINHSNVMEMPDEEPPNVSSVIDKENKEGDEDKELSRQDGNKDAQYSEVKPTENQEMPQNDHSPESVIDDATEHSGIISGNLMEQTEISDTYQSEMTVKSADDSPANQEISSRDDKQDGHPIKQHNYEALEQRNEDHVYDTKEPQISNIQRVDSELSQVYEIGGREESDITPRAEQTDHQEKEGLYSEMETLQSKTDVHSDSQPEQDDTGFNPIGKRRKLASSRRNKGRRHVKGSAESSHEHKEEDVESTRGNEASETADDYSPESVIHDVTEHSGIISGNLMEQTEISETYQSDLTVKMGMMIDDSPANQDISNPDDKQDEHPTKQNNHESEKNEDDHVNDIKEPQISDIERVDTALGQVYEIEGRVEGDTEPSAELTGHQEKEGLFPELECEFSLQALQSDIDAPFDSQPQQNYTGLNPIGNRRKLGSSRRNKGRQHVKDSAAESSHKPTEELVGNTSDNEDLETTEMSLTTETEVQEKSMDTVLEGMDTAQTEDVSDQVKENALVGIDSMYSNSKGDQSNFMLIPDDELPSVCSVTEKASKERDYDKELWRDGNVQNEWVSESQAKSEDKDSSITREISTEKNSPEDLIDIECSVDEPLDTETMKQEEFKKQTDLDFKAAGEMRKTRSTVNDKENTENMSEEDTHLSHTVMDNNAVVTTDRTSSPGEDSVLISNKEVNEEENIFINLTHNLSQLTGCDTVKTDSIPPPEVSSDKETNMQQHNDTSETVGDSVNVQVYEQEEDTGKKDYEATHAELFSAPNNNTDTLAPFNVGLEENIPAEPAVGASEESEISSQQDMEEETNLDDSGNVQGRSKQKRRKMGSTRRNQLNRKPEGKRVETKESDINAEADRGLDEMEAVEGLTMIVTAEISQNENAKPPLSPVYEDQQEPSETRTVHDEMQKLQRSDLQGIQSDMRSDVKDSEALPPEQSASHNEKDDPALFVHVAEIGASERNAGVEPSQVDDFTTSVFAGKNTINPLLSSNIEDITNTDEERPESGNVRHDQALKSATEAPVVADLEMVKSVGGGGGTVETSEQEPDNLNEGACTENLEMKNTSPPIDSTNRRRKMGSTRRNLISRAKQEDLHQKQRADEEAPETASDVGDVKTESLQGIIEDQLQLHLEPLAHRTFEENPVSHSQQAEMEQSAPSDPPALPSTSPKHELLSESASGGRRRKMGSHRKSHGHQNHEKQTTTGDKITDTQNGGDVRGTDESTIKTSAELKEESLGRDKTPKVDQSDKEPLSNISTSKEGEHSRPVSAKTPEPATPVQHLYAEIRLGQGSPQTSSLGNSSGAEFRSNASNVMMIGDSSVGKTSFMKRAHSGKFSLDIPASVGFDSCMWTVVVDGKPVVLQLWDTAGQERFHSITRQIFHKAHAFLLMYDITSSQSFSAVSYWASCIQDGAAENVTVVLVGNKNDCAERQIKTQEGELLAKEYNFEFMECSAATGENVVQSLETVARLLSQKADTREEAATVLHKEPQQKKSSGCC